MLACWTVYGIVWDFCEFGQGGCWVLEDAVVQGEVAEPAGVVGAVDAEGMGGVNIKFFGHVMPIHYINSVLIVYQCAWPVNS